MASAVVVTAKSSARTWRAPPMARSQHACPPRVRGHDQHSREEAAAILLDAGRPVAVVQLALAHHGCGAVGGEVDFDEPVILVLAGSERHQQVGLQDLNAFQPGGEPAPTGWLWFNLDKVDAPVEPCGEGPRRAGPLPACDQETQPKVHGAEPERRHHPP